MTVPLLTVTGLEKQFGDRRVLDDVSLTVHSGQVVAIMGPSGSGKTTLLRSINGLADPDKGTVELGKIRIDYPLDRNGKRSLQALRLETAMVFQTFNLFPHLTAIENVVEGLVHVKGVAKVEARERGLGLLGKMGLADRADDYPARLSGGQKQRVAIARGLALNPTLMLFDEPTSALDPSLRGDVLAAIRDLAESGMTMMIVTHESSFALDVADRILFFSDGRIQIDEPPSYYRDTELPSMIRSYF